MCGDRGSTYFSAEFQLKNPGIFYRFRLRKNSLEPLFAVVGKGSHALDSIGRGDLISMNYYFQDNCIPAEPRVTRIKSIKDGAPMGFKDHFIIALEIQCQGPSTLRKEDK